MITFRLKNFWLTRTLNWKRRFSDFSAKSNFHKMIKLTKNASQNDGTKGKIKSHSQNFIPDPLN